MTIATVMLHNNQPQNLRKQNVGIWLTDLGVNWRFANLGWV